MYWKEKEDTLAWQNEEENFFKRPSELSDDPEPEFDFYGTALNEL